METLRDQSRATLLIVDDSADDVALVSDILKDQYRVKVATNGVRALKIAQSDDPPDLILLDVVMAGLDGYGVCRQLKANSRTRHIPFLFLTSKSTPEDERVGLELGAVDYIRKPIDPVILFARLKTHLATGAAKTSHSEASQADQHGREKEIEQDLAAMILTSLAESRDATTANHALRIQRYVKVLAEALAGHPRFSALAADRAIEVIYRAAVLYDVGKIGVPETILLKPCALLAGEWEVMTGHTTIAARAIERAQEVVGKGSEFSRIAKEMALCHHEKWNGKGYPQGLSGDDIPVAARLVAIADVYDALTRRRTYKDAISHEEAVAEIRRGRGAEFDPEVVDAFVAVSEEMRAIARRFPVPAED
ncbi:response regulator receiver modulated metal dependent phosphohydrolase [Candidatus Koribacter versatilis Ellin345]|uniref:Response regulator receiver modulated metal dependent phosphohydrolase n=1 Tax=Koribacter versatilis (strain Ellin345) TaxID=204669 RepID=Q1IQE5_KORVE|nr:HD domain-containing phosphohydrolase [Candidatus Koribacter versatilis]ABF40905.1 response regulator receiver modulated metal dependent phosphohydrolase [Candidatus Koribacter versatilis Ellin345]